MRPIESYIIYAALYSTWYGFAPLGQLAVAGLGVLLVAHLLLEKPRWQFTLVYAFSLYMLYAVFVDPAKWPGGWLWILFTTALLIFSSAVACLFPVAVFPSLKGSYQHIGVDQSFWEMDHQENPTHPEIGVTVYYPSAEAPPSQPGAQFLSTRVTHALGEYLRIPSFLFHPLSLARTRAVANAPLAAGGKLPVAILSHGLGGVANMYTIMASELASQGYIVVLPTHNDHSACVAELRTTRIPFKRIPLGAEGETRRREQLQARTAEVEFLLQKLPQMDKAGPYAGRLDLERIALVGHSFGGATALLAATRHAPLVKAVVVHDVWCAPLARPSPALLSAEARLPPMLATWSEEWYRGTTEFPTAKALLPQGTMKLGFPDTCHSNYSDVPMFSQLLSRKMNAIGASDFREAIDVINRVQVAYLKKVLQGEGQDLQSILDSKNGFVLLEDDSAVPKA